MERNPVILANGTMFFIQPNGANTVQAGQVIPGMVQSVQYGGQQPGNPSNYPQQNRQVSEMEKLIMEETKTLGAIQIIIGLIHIGFGAVSVTLYGTPYVNMTAVVGYPFWAGLFFIASGSLSVTAEKNLRDTVVKCSLGMNITSAVVAFIGAILYIIELMLNTAFYYSEHPNSYYDAKILSAGNGFSALFLLFNILEFCITISTAYFKSHGGGCCNNEQAMVIVPYATTGAGVAPAEFNPPPPPLPAYDNTAFSPMAQ